MDTLAQNFHGLNKFTQESISKISQKIRALEAKRSPTAGVSGSVEYRRLLDRIGIVDDIVERNTQDISKGDKVLAKMDAKINNLKRKFLRIDSAFVITSELSNGGAGATALDERIRTLEDRALKLGTGTNGDVDDLGCKVVELSDRLDKAEAKGSDEYFTMEDFTFGSYGDFAAFILEQKVPTCGMFWNIFSCLVIMRPKGQSGKERADEQHSSERINTSIFENNLLAAMGHARPAALFSTKGGTGVLVNSETGFGACTSYEKW
jgi:hypothetical protein